MPRPVDDGPEARSTEIAREDSPGTRTPTGAPAVPDPCARIRESLDPYLDGDLSAHEAAGLEAHLSRCPACRDELDLARELATALRAGIPLLACPPRVTAEVLRVAREEVASGAARGEAGERRQRRAGSDLGGRLRRWLGGGGRLRPALLGAALALLLVAPPLLYRALVPGGSPAHGAGPAGAVPMAATGRGPASGVAIPETLSPEELARADREARLVLAYVAAIGRDASRSLRDEVFTDGIVRPAREAVAELQAGGADDRRKP